MTEQYKIFSRLFSFVTKSINLIADSYVRGIALLRYLTYNYLHKFFQ